jgi:hypothetical protein
VGHGCSGDQVLAEASGLNDRKEMSAMKVKSSRKQITEEEYNDKHGVLGEITDEKVALSLNDALTRLSLFAP